MDRVSEILQRLGHLQVCLIQPVFSDLDAQPLYDFLALVGIALVKIGEPVYLSLAGLNQRIAGIVFFLVHPLDIAVAVLPDQSAKLLNRPLFSHGYQRGIIDRGHIYDIRQAV